MNPININEVLAEIIEYQKQLKDQAQKGCLLLKGIFLYLRSKDERVHKITITYEGSGDSGDISDITVEPAECNTEILKELNQLLDEDMPAEFNYQRTVGQQYDSKAMCWKPVVAPDPSSISEALDAIAWDVAYGYHPGFEINEGGFGEIIIRQATEEELEDGIEHGVSIEINHNNNVITQDYSTVTL